MNSTGRSLFVLRKRHLKRHFTVALMQSQRRKKITRSHYLRGDRKLPRHMLLYRKRILRFIRPSLAVWRQKHWADVLGKTRIADAQKGQPLAHGIMIETWKCLGEQMHLSIGMGAPSSLPSLDFMPLQVLVASVPDFVVQTSYDAFALQKMSLLRQSPKFWQLAEQVDWVINSSLIGYSADDIARFMRHQATSPFWTILNDRVRLSG